MIARLDVWLKAWLKAWLKGLGFNWSVYWKAFLLMCVAFDAGYSRAGRHAAALAWDLPTFVFFWDMLLASAFVLWLTRSCIDVSGGKNLKAGRNLTPDDIGPGRGPGRGPGMGRGSYNHPEFVMPPMPEALRQYHERRLQTDPEYKQQFESAQEMLRRQHLKGRWN